MRTAKLLAMLSLSFTIFISCEKDNETRDTVKPRITDVLINGSPEVATVYASDTLTLSALFKDERGLGKLEIVVTGESGTNWTERKYVNLSGESQKVTENIIVPANASEGIYVLSYEFTDNGGNKSVYSHQPFQLINESVPEVANFKVDFDDGDYNYQDGDTLRFYGLVTDDEDLQMVAIKINIPVGYSADPLFYSDQIELEGLNDTSWDFEKDGEVKVHFPPYSKTGGYSLQVVIRDNKNNQIKLSTTVVL